MVESGQEIEEAKRKIRNEGGFSNENCWLV